MHPMSRAVVATAAGLLLSMVLFTTAPGQAAKAPATVAAPARDVDARPWPREFTVDGVQFSLFRPQIDEWNGNKLQARAVMAVKTGETKDASGKTIATQDFGVLWFTARAQTDKKAREAVLQNIVVERANFPTAKDKEAAYLAIARKAAPSAAQVASLDALEASLAITEARKGGMTSQPVDNTPPEIIFAFKPAVLILIDGEPVLRQTGVAGVERVINTRAVLLRHGGAYYLGHDGVWATAASLQGAWSSLAKPPAPVAQVAAQLAAAQPGGKTAPPPPGAAAPRPKGMPTVYVRSKPTELIVVEGEPAFEAISGTSLKYVANTPADVLIDAAGNWYTVLAGRWFTAASTQGPWNYVPPRTLPADFAKIPGASPKSAVLASIPGTPEAQESLIANAIPQTATVNRREARFEAHYDGPPNFEAIEGAQGLAYAVNSGTPIIRTAGGYYALENAIWFVATSPNGPWTAATSVPAEIYTIPSNSPLHYVTYAYVYGSEGDEVYTGYTPGYYGTIVHDGVVIYGAGYACEPWVGQVWYGCPEPYGYGASFGYSEAAGWSLAFGWGWYDPWYYPWWGGWGWYPGWYYPGGVIAGNFYGRWGNAVVAGTGAAWADAWTGNYGRAAQGGYFNERTGGRGYGYASRNTNIYTGNSVAAGGGVRYNPQTGRVVAGQGGSVSNIYTGQGVAGGTRTAVNTETGRVTRSGGVAGRGEQGAGAAGGFRTSGAAGDAAGAGYVRYDRETGDISKGGVVDINGDVYAGRDGNVYKRTEDGWESVGKDGRTERTNVPDRSLDAERAARDRGFERDRKSGAGFERSGASRGSFDRGSYGGGFSGSMGGHRGSMGGFRGGGGFRR